MLVHVINEVPYTPGMLINVIYEIIYTPCMAVNGINEVTCSLCMSLNVLSTHLEDPLRHVIPTVNGLKNGMGVQKHAWLLRW